MVLIVPRAHLLEQLQVALQGSRPLILHSDILRIGIIDSLKDRDAMCRDYQEVLEEVTASRTLLIPTFNYDYCRDGIYDVQNSPSQVGALTDYYRRTFSRERTHTPVFNFCIRNNIGFTQTPIENCFGRSSAFGQLVEFDGFVAFLGADFSCNTFLHHVEEMCDIIYRFHKVFEGFIVDVDQRIPAKLVYRVRPLEPPNAVVYDWDRLQTDLEREGILTSFQAGHGILRLFRARDLLDYWFGKILANPRYLLVS